jgi:cysteinyl-tRNA synthetase
MSKSLKNFITIREILALYNPTQIRMLFLLQAWDKKMNYQRVDTMVEADTKILAFSEFFRKVCSLGVDWCLSHC